MQENKTEGKMQDYITNRCSLLNWKVDIFNIGILVIKELSTNLAPIVMTINFGKILPNEKRMIIIFGKGTKLMLHNNLVEADCGKLRQFFQQI